MFGKEGLRMERIINFLPTLIVIESIFASIIYAIDKRWGSALYWISAALLNISAIWLIKKVG
jgi:hypothetical protein